MLVIQLTPLSYRIPVGRNGQLIGTHLFLEKYLRRFNQNVWDHRLRRYILYRRYVRFNEKTGILHIPRYDFGNFCQYLRQNNVSYTTEQVPLQYGLPVTIPLKHNIKDRDERQTKAIEYLSTSQESLRGLALTTGIGKTYCDIKTMSLIGRRAIVFVGGLIEQWYQEILNFTNLFEDDIYIIQGAVSVTKLLEGIDKTIFPKIILCSLGTIRAYATGGEAYENHPPFTSLFDILKIGVKTIDEAHLNFFLTLMIDLQTNAAVNIALTATFDRGDYQVKQIFDAHYPFLMRFGENEFIRYVDIYSYTFSLGGMLKGKYYSTEKGYNHSKLEEWFLRRGLNHLNYIYKTVYSPIIFSHFINIKSENQKLLILCSTLAMCQWFKDKLDREIPKENNLIINLYNYGTDDDILKTADIIISTPGSAGTGTDIKNLRTLLMTIATGSDTTNKQTLGRLRELSNGDTPIYVYTWMTDIPAHCKYQEVRKTTFLSRGRTYNEISF